MKRFATVCMVLATMVLASCNCAQKMQKNIDKIEVACNPEVMTLKGSTVTAEVTVTFPPRYFDEETIMKITPVLVYEGGEIAGTPKFVQGEYVEDNYTTIVKAEGGSYTQTVTFPYTPAANKGTLELRFESRCADDCSPKFADFVPFAAIAAAQGIDATQNVANNAEGMGYMKDNFSRVTTISSEAEIKYLINSAKVRPAQLSEASINEFEAFIKENAEKANVTLGNVFSKGYASPDGPENFNDKLSKQRSESGQTAIQEKLEGVNVSYDAAAYGEDWDGFKALVEASSLKDKDLILNVLSMYSNPAKRDQEIKNLSSVYKVLAEEILPELRRTQFVATAEVEGMTDAQLLAAAKANNKNLTVEEMLYAATLTNNAAEKAAIYNMAAQTYNDVRAWNNLAVAEAAQGKLAEAKAALQKAAQLKSAPEITNNLAMVAVAQGNVAEAKQYLNSLGANEAKTAKGLLALAEGDYSAASAQLTGYNKAVAEVCNNNLAAAKSAIANDNSADAEYLKAVIAAKEGDSKAAASYLNSAIAKNPALKAQAQNDANFAKFAAELGL